MALAGSGYTKDNQEVRHVDGVPALTKHLTLMEPNSVTEEDFNISCLCECRISEGLLRYHPECEDLCQLHNSRCCWQWRRKCKSNNQFCCASFGELRGQRHYVSQHKQKINSPAVKAWMKLRGGKYVVNKYAKIFMKNYKSD